MVSRAGVALVLLVGCGSDHAGFISQTPGAGGKTGSGGAHTVDAGSGGSEETGGAPEGRGGSVFGAGGRKTGTGGKGGTAGNGGTGGEMEAGTAGSDSGVPPVNAPPWALTEPFDQTQVYMMGILDYSGCNGTEVLATVTDFDKYTIGFECSLPIRMFITRGKLYYEHPTGAALYQFIPELVEPYPVMSYANDKKLNTPCTSLINGVVVNPSGELYYHCMSSGWYALGGASVHSGDEDFTAMTDGHLMAISDKSGSATGAGVMLLSDGVFHEVPLMGSNPWGYRVHGETFHFIVGGDPLQLFSVDASGQTTKLGDFPSTGGNIKEILGPDDAYYGNSYNIQTRAGNLSRQTIDGKNETLHTNQEMRPVRIGALPFVTGP